ncbi:MAG: hypothetical protein E7G72_09710, partial [Staphylococcus epidermidis]|nr:hypothetical protein [Staphylococcus epidermidis]
LLRSKSYFWLCMCFSSGVSLFFYEVNRTFGYACALAHAFLLILLIILIKVQKKQAPKTLSSFDA